MFRTLMDSMRQEFQRSGGFPPLAARRAVDDGPVYWWRFTDTLLIKFVVTEQPRRPRGWWDVGRVISRWIRLVTRKVVVTEAFHPPPQF